MKHPLAPIALVFVALLATWASAEPLVERSCTVIDLSGNGSKTTRLALNATEAGGKASGTVRATPTGEYSALQVDIRNLPPAEQSGSQNLTHVMWAVSPDGTATSLGELEVKNSRARFDASASGDRFGLLVTAEPYFAVSRPSSAVLLELAIDTKSKSASAGTAVCTVVDSRSYSFGRTDVAIALTLKRDDKTSPDLLQARHAYKIAELAGAADSLPGELEGVAAMLLEAEKAHSSKAGSPTTIAKARESVIAAEKVRIESAIAAERAAKNAEAARKLAEQRVAEEREAARIAAEQRKTAEQEDARVATERRESQQRELEALAVEREAQEAELAQLAAERAALRQEIEEEARLRAEATATTTTQPAMPSDPDATPAAADAADASLQAERSRLSAERLQLNAERAKQQADVEAERTRIESERATLLAQLAEENVAREREANATVRAEAEEARRQAVQARIEAEVAKREAEITAERALIEVERAQLDSQRKTTEAEAAMRQQMQAAAAEQTAIRTAEQQQAELERMRQQFELEAQQRELERERETLVAEKLVQQTTIEENRLQLDSERSQIVSQLEADQARLAAEREELERVRREDQAQREAEAKAAEEDRARQLAEGRAAMQSELEQQRATMQASMQQEMQAEMAAERERLQKEMRAEMEAERARLRVDFERQSQQIEQQAAASEALRVERAESERLARRERLLGQLTEVLEARDTERGLLANLSGVSFAAGQHELQAEAREKLARLAGILVANPSLTMTIEGHTDSMGSMEGNQVLSERRANAVRDYLFSQGVPAESMTSAGFGATLPIESNDTVTGRRANRRIEVVISGAAIDR